MEKIKIEMTKIDPKTRKANNYQAEVQSERDENHNIMSLTYEGYRSEWKLVEGN